MDRTISRRLLWAYALLLLIAALGYARYDTYTMDGDGTAFIDIAQGLTGGHPGLAINGYWNPAYPAAIAIGNAFAHSALWRELVVLRYTNVAIFVLAMAGCVFFTTGLTRARSGFAKEGDRAAAVSPGALHLLGLATLFLGLGRELPIPAPRSDTLLCAFLLFAAGSLLRILSGGAPWSFPALGVSLGLAYLTKSFGFLPSLLLLLGLLAYGLRGRGAPRTRFVGGVALSALLFAALAGPYIFAISRQLGHVTTGESARMNYAFFIDLTSRWHEWYRGDLGHATGPFLHAETVIGGPPAVFSFAAHPFGTFPLWFDPAWWTLGLKPHVYLLGHLHRALRNVALLVRYLLERPEILVLLAAVLRFGAAWPRLRERHELRSSVWALAPLAWGVLMFAIYFPIDLQARYLTAPFLLILLPIFALLRVRGASPQSAAATGYPATALVATAMIVLYAGLGLTEAFAYLAEHRRQTSIADQRHPGYDPETFPAAAALDQLGLQPGDKIACMSDRACYTDHYWARLAGTQILAQVDTPNEADPQTVWDSIPDKNTVTEPLKRMGLRYIVTIFRNSARKPDGWVQLGHTDFFAYPLQAPISASQAAASAAFVPTP